MSLFISRLSGSCPTPLLSITYIFLLLYFCNVFFNVRSGYMFFRHSQKLFHNKLYWFPSYFGLSSRAIAQRNVPSFGKKEHGFKLWHMYRFSLFSIMEGNIKSYKPKNISNNCVSTLTNTFSVTATPTKFLTIIVICTLC